nr:MAG TPA: hypothetical protein [Caudoviricetes sp.]
MSDYKKKDFDKIINIVKDKLSTEISKDLKELIKYDNLNDYRDEHLVDYMALDIHKQIGSKLTRELIKDIIAKRDDDEVDLLEHLFETMIFAAIRKATLNALADYEAQKSKKESKNKDEPKIDENLLAISDAAKKNFARILSEQVDVFVEGGSLRKWRQNNLANYIAIDVYDAITEESRKVLEKIIGTATGVDNPEFINHITNVLMYLAARQAAGEAIADAEDK